AKPWRRRLSRLVRPVRSTCRQFVQGYSVLSTEYSRLFSRILPIRTYVRSIRSTMCTGELFHLDQFYSRLFSHTVLTYWLGFPELRFARLRRSICGRSAQD